MSQDKQVVLTKAMTWGGKNYAAGQNTMPEAAAASAVKRNLGTLRESQGGSSGENETKEKTENQTKEVTGLPEDFPMRHVFEKLGTDFDSVEKIQGKSLEELIAIDGVGEATAKKALEYGK